MTNIRAKDVYWFLGLTIAGFCLPFACRIAYLEDIVSKQKFMLVLLFGMLSLSVVCYLASRTRSSSDHNVVHSPRDVN